MCSNDLSYEQERINKSSGQSPFPMTTVIKDLPAEDDEEEGSDEDDDEDEEETALEGYTTPLDADNCDIDEYVIFKQVLEEARNTNPAWYNILTSALSGDQQKALADVIVLADQRRAAAESKRIEEAGGDPRRWHSKDWRVLTVSIHVSAGYSFNQQTVPTTFNFGGGPGNGSTSPFSR